MPNASQWCSSRTARFGERCESVSKDVWNQYIEDLLKAIEPSRAGEAEVTNGVAPQATPQLPRVTQILLAVRAARARIPRSATPADAGAAASAGGPAADRSGAQMRQSTADRELLESLTAKINTLGDTPGTKTPAALPRPPERAQPPSSSSASVAAAGSDTAIPLPHAAAIVSNVRPKPHSADSSLSLESTQTVRPITPLELADGMTSQWFAIQLTLSANPIDAAEVPNLDLFQEYKLYCVSGPERGRLMHALRLGFFSSEVAAKAVTHYLGAYFPESTIKRVSIAERARFEDELFTARKDIGAAGRQAVIELVGTSTTPPEVDIGSPRPRVTKPSLHADTRFWSSLRDRVAGLMGLRVGNFLH